MAVALFLGYFVFGVLLVVLLIGLAVAVIRGVFASFRRKSDGARFLAVWQNVPDPLGFEPIYRVLDEMIKNWP